MYKLLETYLTVITKKGKTHSLLYNMLLINILINEHNPGGYNNNPVSR